MTALAALATPRGPRGPAHAEPPQNGITIMSRVDDACSETPKRRRGETTLTPEQRSQRARLAALARWSKENPAANAARGQAGLLARFEREVDPDNQLDPVERRRRAECARRLHMARLSYRSSRARSRKGAA